MHFARGSPDKTKGENNKIFNFKKSWTTYLVSFVWTKFRNVYKACGEYLDI